MTDEPVGRAAAVGSVAETSFGGADDEYLSIAAGLHINAAEEDEGDDGDFVC